jgi:hypothetical protein
MQYANVAMFIFCPRLANFARHSRSVFLSSLRVFFQWRIITKAFLPQHGTPVGSSLRRARHFLRCVCIFISASVDRDRGADYRWSEALGALAQAISSSTHPRHDLGDFTPDGLLCACEGESVFCELMHELLLLMKYEKNEDKKTCARILAKRINDTLGSLWSFCNFQHWNAIQKLSCFF